MNRLFDTRFALLRANGEFPSVLIIANACFPFALSSPRSGRIEGPVRSCFDTAAKPPTQHERIFRRALDRQ